MERVIAYVDGYNLYYGLREKKWKRFYWLNIQMMVEHLLKPDQTLIVTKYFTTIVKRPEERRKRQAVFLEALQILNDFKFYYGHFLAETVCCRNCGHTYETYHEKMTDVNISVELMTDTFQDQFDVAVLVSADSDLVGPVKAVRRLFNRKRIVVAFPPGRSSKALKQAADAQIYIGRNVLAKSLFPDQIVKPDGYILHRPEQWQ
jgi:uncharacterized LabA/DUF88 family protein